MDTGERKRLLEYTNPHLISAHVWKSRRIERHYHPFCWCHALLIALMVLAVWLAGCGAGGYLYAGEGLSYSERLGKCMRETTMSEYECHQMVGEPPEQTRPVYVRPPQYRVPRPR
jgi:hypothetical protein